ncbi:hypothetical protein FRB93_002784 [Tulasnella sp. JGI-2019a]|nr:hypothetical protein FRB93_002784 [Tulasnella sp. JGI-2019a]
MLSAPSPDGAAPSGEASLPAIGLPTSTAHLASRGRSPVKPRGLEPIVEIPFYSLTKKWPATAHASSERRTLATTNHQGPSATSSAGPHAAQGARITANNNSAGVGIGGDERDDERVHNTPNKTTSTDRKRSALAGPSKPTKPSKLRKTHDVAPKFNLPPAPMDPMATEATASTNSNTPIPEDTDHAPALTLFLNLLSSSAPGVQETTPPPPHDMRREGLRHITPAHRPSDTTAAPTWLAPFPASMTYSISPSPGPSKSRESSVDIVVDMLDAPPPQLEEGRNRGRKEVSVSELVDDRAAEPPVDAKDAPLVKRGRGRPRKLKPPGGVISVQKRPMGNPGRKTLEQKLKRPPGRPRRDGRPARSVPKAERARAAVLPSSTATQPPPGPAMGASPLLHWEGVQPGLPVVSIPGGPVLPVAPSGYSAYPFRDPYAYAAALTARFPQPGTVPGQSATIPKDTTANAVAGSSAVSTAMNTNARRAVPLPQVKGIPGLSAHQISHHLLNLEATRTPGQVVGHDDEIDEDDDGIFLHQPARLHTFSSSAASQPEADPQLGTSRNSRTIPPQIVAAYEMHIPLLHKRTESGMPMLYEQYQTFWVPQKSNFFLLTGSSVGTLVNIPDSANGSGSNATPVARSSTTSIQLYNPAFFFWDPLPLVLGGIKCPGCKNALKRGGHIKSPRKVLIATSGPATDVAPSVGEACFWICGAWYKCATCINTRTQKQGVAYQSWDQRILDLLPALLRSEFPAVKTEGRGNIARESTLPERLCVQSPVTSGPVLASTHALPQPPPKAQFPDVIASGGTLATVERAPSANAPTPEAQPPDIIGHSSAVPAHRALAALRGPPSPPFIPRSSSSMAVQSSQQPDVDVVHDIQPTVPGDARAQADTGAAQVGDGDVPHLMASSDFAVAGTSALLPNGSAVVLSSISMEGAEEGAASGQEVQHPARASDTLTSAVTEKVKRKRGCPPGSTKGKSTVTNSAPASTVGSPDQPQTTAIIQQLYKRIISQPKLPISDNYVNDATPRTSISWHSIPSGLVPLPSATAASGPSAPPTAPKLVLQQQRRSGASNQIRSFIGASLIAERGKVSSQSSVVAQPPQSQSQPQLQTQNRAVAGPSQPFTQTIINSSPHPQTPSQGSASSSSSALWSGSVYLNPNTHAPSHTQVEQGPATTSATSTDDPSSSDVA